MKYCPDGIVREADCLISSADCDLRPIHGRRVTDIDPDSAADA